MARWLRHLYPHAEGDSWLPGLVPDVLGDALLAAVLAESPSIARGLLDEPSPEQAQSVLQLSIAPRAPTTGWRGCSASSSARGCERCGRRRLVVSVQSGGPGSPSVVSGASWPWSPTPSSRARCSAEIPDSTVALRELAAVAGGLVVEGRRAAAQQDPAARPALAQALDRHAIRLSDLGRLDEALGAAEQAVDLQRELASEDLDDKRRLAAALRSLSNRRAALGGHQAALDANEEAVDLFRAVQDGGPGAKLELAGTLSNLSSNLGEVGRVDEALDAVQEAIAILDPLFRSTLSELVAAALAGAYTNFSNRLSDAGYDEEALAATRHAIAGYRRLAEEQPDAYAAKLAETLANVAVDLRSTGAPDEAVAAPRRPSRLLRSTRGSLTLPAVRGGAGLAVVLAVGRRARGRGAARERGAGRAAARPRRARPRASPSRSEALDNLAVDLRTGLGLQHRRREAASADAWPSARQSVVAKAGGVGRLRAAEPRQHRAAQEAPLVADPAARQLARVREGAYGRGVGLQQLGRLLGVSTSGAPRHEVGAADDHVGAGRDRHREREAGAGRCQRTSASSRRSATSRRTTSRSGIRRSNAKRSSFSASSRGRRTNRAAVSSARRLRCLAMRPG